MKKEVKRDTLPHYMRPTAASQAKQKPLVKKEEEKKEEKKIPVRMNENDDL